MAKLEKTLAKAKESAFRLLKLRARSEKEIRQKLVQKEFDQATIDQTLDYLKKSRLVDDHDFAQKWIEWRSLKALGINRIKFELREKGINEEIIAEMLEAYQQQVDVDEMIEKIIERRKGFIKEQDPQKVRSKLYGYLLRKGFPSAKVVKALKKLC